MRVRGWWGVTPLLWALLLGGFFTLPAAAQTAQTSAGARDIVLELGFSGEMVADAWNPLRLTMRGVGGAELVIDIDQGGLREGPRLVRYRAPLPAGGGMAVFEDDIYLPPRWRSFAWAVRAGDVTLASGTLDPRVALNPRPLQLVSADGVGRWRALFEGSSNSSGGSDTGGSSTLSSDSTNDNARVIEVTGTLPERAAAYDGVETLLLDGTAPAPRLEAVTAAAAAGVTVLLIDPLPQSFAPLRALAPEPAQRLGSGWLMRSSDGGEVTASPEILPDAVDASALTRALLTPDLLEAPQGAPTKPLLVGLTAYLLLTFLLVRFGGTPGLLTALAVVPLASLAAWGYVRPSSATPVRSRTLSVGANGLATRGEVMTFFRFSGGEVTGPSAARLLEADTLATNTVAEALKNVLEDASPPLGVSGPAATDVLYERTPEGLRFQLPRWSSVALLLAPRLEPAHLNWQDGALVHRGEDALVDVYVVGMGLQEAIAPDSTQTPRAGEENTRDLPLVYRELLPRLPEGAAIARQGGHIYVALPEPDSLQKRDAQSVEGENSDLQGDTQSSGRKAQSQLTRVGRAP